MNKETLKQLEQILEDMKSIDGSLSSIHASLERMNQSIDRLGNLSVGIERLGRKGSKSLWDMLI